VDQPNPSLSWNGKQPREAGTGSDTTGEQVVLVLGERKHAVIYIFTDGARTMPQQDLRLRAAVLAYWELVQWVSFHTVNTGLGATSEYVKESA
jgi:hypothetical protein